jgi:hypothetical protein
MSLLFTPGAPREEYFEPSRTRPATRYRPEQGAKFMARHDTHGI